MNGKDLLHGMNYVNSKFVEEAENTVLNGNDSHYRLKRPFQIAAIVALMLLLVGCAVVYVLNMQGLKLGERQEQYDAFSDDGLEYLGKETVTEQVLTLAGLQGTPAYQAAQEWFDFKQSYDPDRAIQHSVWGNYPEFPAEYDGYGLYSQEMKDKLDEIIDKYNLKLQGSVVPFRTTKLTLKALDIENILAPGSDADMTITDASYYENGNLNIGFDIILPDGEATWGNLYYRRKDCIIDDTCIISGNDWKEWNYTTASGHDVLIIRSPSSWVAWIFCDMGDSTAAVRFEAIHEVYSELPDGTDVVESTEMTDRQLELLADSIDFSIKPKLMDGYENIPDGAVGSGEEVNGYSVRLKSVETDGYSAQITLGITAPEGTVLIDPEIEHYNITPGNWVHGFFEPVTELDTVGAGRSGGVQDDGDGLPNTIDYVLDADCTTNDGSMPFGPDTVWNIYFEDIYGTYWDEERVKQVDELIAEGVWSIDINFEGNALREIELLSQPITAKACTGWKLDGTDVFEELEITSVKLRSLSVELTCENKSADFFSFTGKTSYVVMKDGSRVEFTSSELHQPIEPNQVSHIILADGTIIPVPGVEVELPEETASDAPETDGVELLSQPMDYKSLGGYAIGPDGIKEPLYETFHLTSVTLSPDRLTIKGTWAFDGPDTQMQVVMGDGSQVTLTGSAGSPYAEPMSVLSAQAPMDLTQAAYVLFPDGTKLEVPQ